MTRDERQRYARQVQLTEIGPAGQALLMATRVSVPAGPAGEVAADYLARAGVGIDPDAPTLILPDVTAAGPASIAADALRGSFAAVEAIVDALGIIREPHPLPSLDGLDA